MPLEHARDGEGRCSALLKRESVKNVKYREKARLRGNSLRPLVFETHGRPGADARAFLRILTSWPGSSLSMPVSDCMMQLQLQLLRGNSRMASSCIMRARYHRARGQDARYLDLANEPCSALFSFIVFLVRGH